jgi:sulfur transfer complex TusBCD TusB component (DsrH family)
MLCLVFGAVFLEMEQALFFRHLLEWSKDYLRLRDFQARYITAEMRNVESSAFGNDGK